MSGRVFFSILDGEDDEVDGKEDHEKQKSRVCKKKEVEDIPGSHGA